MPPGLLKIIKKSYSTDAPTSDMSINTVKYQVRLLLHCQCNKHVCWLCATPCRELLSCCSCNIYACLPRVFTATNTAVVQICLQVECCCKIDACWTVAIQSAYLLIFCHSILHVCWCCAFLLAIPVGMMTHYKPCLLVWCLATVWCLTYFHCLSYLLVRRYYRSCLLV